MHKMNIDVMKINIHTSLCIFQIKVLCFIKIYYKVIGLLALKDTNIIIMALLCGYIQAYDIVLKWTNYNPNCLFFLIYFKINSNSKIVWKAKLNDTVNHMINVNYGFNRVYCGLSNGSLAILEVTLENKNNTLSYWLLINNKNKILGRGWTWARRHIL